MSMHVFHRAHGVYMTWTEFVTAVEAQGVQPTDQLGALLLDTARALPAETVDVLRRWIQAEQHPSAQGCWVVAIAVTAQAILGVHAPRP
jgi:hypothetical protein